MADKGSLLVISGFSGTGKGTVVEYIMKNFSHYSLSISATTRNPRPGEKEGVSYFYKSTEEFENMIKNDDLLEYAKYVDHYYGTPKSYVMDQLEKGNNVILEIESVGALNVKKIFPKAKLLFLIPPSAKELENRLRGRKTEDEATIRARLAKAYNEADCVEKYDFVVINDSVGNCADKIEAISSGDKKAMTECDTEANMNLVRQIKSDLKEFVEGE